METIDSFAGDNFFLSNFYSCEVVFEGLKYPSSEHAYQAAKTLDSGQRRKIRSARSAGESKRLGRHVRLRKDWESIKYNVMVAILRDKFSRYEDLKKKLLATGDAELIEGNGWGDKTWGCIRKNSSKPWIGKNWLGKALMQVRSEINGI